MKIECTWLQKADEIEKLVHIEQNKSEPNGEPLMIYKPKDCKTHCEIHIEGCLQFSKIYIQSSSRFVEIYIDDYNYVGTCRFDKRVGLVNGFYNCETPTMKKTCNKLIFKFLSLLQKDQVNLSSIHIIGTVNQALKNESKPKDVQQMDIISMLHNTRESGNLLNTLQMPPVRQTAIKQQEPLPSQSSVFGIVSLMDSKMKEYVKSYIDSQMETTVKKYVDEQIDKKMQEMERRILAKLQLNRNSQETS